MSGAAGRAERLEKVVADHVRPLTRRYVGLVAGAVVGDLTATAGAGREAAPRSQAPDDTTIFQIGSITKVFTSLLLAVAVERGEVALDQPVATLIPGTASHSSGLQITLADLATHRAGLPRLPRNILWRGLLHPSDPYARVTTADLEAALARPPRRPPGGRARYSNFGAGVLGEALSRAAGRPYGDLVVERICAPLGLDDTAVTLDPARRDRLATGHSRRRRPVTAWRLPALPGAGALWSTAADLLAFARAHLAPHGALAAPLAAVQQPRGRIGRRARIALGWHILDRDDGRSWLYHNGGTGGFFSMLAMDPRAGAAAVALTNTSRPVDRVALTLLERAIAAVEAA